MSGSPCVQCRVTPQLKARLGALAQHHQITESALLHRIIDMALLQTTGVTEREAIAPPDGNPAWG